MLRPLHRFYPPPVLQPSNKLQSRLHNHLQQSGLCFHTEGCCEGKAAEVKPECGGVYRLNPETLAGRCVHSRRYTSRAPLFSC
ncbi:hypothetical protein CesoFtcFv8_025969 [Champsocephalus esox]|uniref:Uncharacterized protein n=2 Tax=Champsocephalus TaxID=52236 RepID=A0AAN8C2X6_CHAGU|nr:hypothetical protein CesoFtcFv8_025969 [Champsocephalus esox]KAK5895835.1 hypothetical protein CgunFtcFv8_009492 [Champsocephalus gunnari]